MTTAQIESPFFISEAEALRVIADNMDEIKARINASSGQVANESANDSSNFDPDSLGKPCNGSPGNGLPGDDPNFIQSCQCCAC